VHADDVLEGPEGIEDEAIEVAGVEEDAVLLLGGEEGIEDEVVTLADGAGVAGVLDGAGVIGHDGDEDDLGGLDVIDADAEPGLDLSTEVDNGEGLKGLGAEDTFGVSGLEEL
jgi:hypothetical protein